MKSDHNRYARLRMSQQNYSTQDHLKWFLIVIVLEFNKKRRTYLHDFPEFQYNMRENARLISRHVFKVL
jgi:hypothetical protein